MAAKKVKSYTYNGQKYNLYYDPSDGSHQLKRSVFGINNDVTVFDNGGWTVEGTDDTNINSMLLDVSDDIKNGLGEAYKKSGGTANGSILPAWIQNKFPTFITGLDNSISGLDSGVSTDLSKDYGKNDKFFGGVGKSAQYPIDALYSTTLSDRGTKDGIIKGGEERQDHLAISQYKYKVPRANELFGKKQSGALLTKGLTRNSPLEKFLGIVKLPMPNDISDSNNVAWGEDKMNSLEAAGISQFSDFGGTDALAMAGGAFGEALGGSGSMQAAILLRIIGGADVSKVKEAYGAEAVSRVLSMGGIDAPAESILARGFGIVPNSNLELLFQAPMLREFQFMYKMSPRSGDEATVINQIVRFFKQGMAAKKVNQTAGQIGGGASFFLGTPNVFRLQYRTTNNNAPAGVNRIKTCALTGTSVNYTPEGTWTSYENGQPVSIMLTLRFQELEPLYDTDYSEAAAGSDSVRDNDTTSLGHKLSIGPNEVGY